MATWQTATDAFGIVNPQGNRGAAQIFKGDAVDTNLDRLDKAQAVKLATQKRKKAEEDAMRDALKLEYGGWKAADGQKLGELYQQYLEKGKEGILKGINPKDNMELLQMEGLLKTAAKTGEEERKYYEKAMMTFMENKDQYDPEEAQNFLERADKYFKSGFGNRKAEDLALPKKIEEEKPYDLMQALEKIDVGYIEKTDLDDEGKGTKTKNVRKNDLLSQSRGLVDADKKYYDEGLKLGLWTNKDEAAEWTYNQKLWQADTSVQDIFRQSPKDNVFGSGASSKEVEEDFNKWKQDLKNGDENAAGYLFNAQLPSGNRIGRFKVVPTIEEEQGYSAKGYAPRIKYLFNAENKDKVVAEELILEPLIENETMLYKLYISALKDKNRTYNKELSERSAGTRVVQDKPKAETNTPKTPSAVKFKGVPKGGF